MNNKMVINIYQQLNQETNQANKKNRDRIMDTENFLMVARLGGGVVRGNG